MEDQIIESVVEDLETFIELKRQNFLIHAWIQLKKSSKFGARTSRSKAATTSLKLNPNHYVPYQSNYILNGVLSKSQASESPRRQSKYDKLITDYEKMGQINDSMFQTFNKNGSVNPFYNRNDTSHLYPQEEQNTEDINDLQDSDQFQDIVLDRLSKLEESINSIMKEKRVKQDLRGYVGAPIQPSRIRQDFAQEEPEVNRKGNFREDFGSSLTPKYKNTRKYQQWQTSPVKNKGPSDTIYNLKYISIEPNSPVQVNKIKQILGRQKSQKGRSSDTSSKQGYKPKQYNFEEMKPEREKSNSSGPKIFIQEPPRFGGVDFNRYGASRTSRNNSRIQFIPRHIEMNTVIETGTKYKRTLNSNLDNTSKPKESSKEPITKDYYRPRKSGDSSSSKHSYFSMPSWRANLSTYY